MEKHVLVVGGLLEGHKRLKNFGCTLTLLTPLSQLLSLKTLDIYDRIYGVPDEAPVEEWIEYAKTIHYLLPIYRVVGYHELTEEYAALIAKAMEHPFHPAEVIRRTHNKHQMRQVLQCAGIDSTASERVQTLEEIKIFAEEHGYPIILKPLDGRGSVGVSPIKEPDDIEPALMWFKEWAADAEMYVEQFLEGEEYSVEAISEQGTHYIVCITQNYKETEHCVEIGHGVPAVVSEERREAIDHIVKQTLTAIGIENGASHTEIIVTRQGPRVVETHTRLPGGYVPDLIRILTGVDLLDLWIRQSLGETIKDELHIAFPKDNAACVWYESIPAIGRLEGIEGDETARSMPGIMRVELHQSPGTHLNGGIRNSFSRAASVIAVGQTLDEAADRAQEGCKQLRFLISCDG